MAAIAIAGLWFARYYQSLPVAPSQPLAVRISGVLEQEPDVYGSTQRFSLSHYRITTHRYPNFHYGDRVRVEGILTPDLSLRYPQIAVEERDVGFVLLKLLQTVRQTMLGNIRENLAEPEASLVAGMVFGDQSGMTRSFREILLKTGTIHVVVASGMNVSLLAGAVFSLAGWISRRTLLIINSFMILLYMGLVGFDPPIVRASVMSWLAFAALAWGRQQHALWFLVLTILGMLWVEPSLLRSVSFQLSVAATAGVVTVGMTNTLSKGVSKRASGITAPLRAAFIQDLFTTLGAQVAVLPLLIHYFHRISLISPLANALILWTVAPLMVLGGVYSLVVLVLPQAGHVCAWALWPVAHLFVSAVRFFSEIPGANLQVPAPPVWVWGVYYLVLVMFSFALRARKAQT